MRQFISYTLITLFLSCSSNENKSAQLENKLDSTIKLIESYKSQKYNDSITQELRMQNIEDSLKRTLPVNDLASTYESVKNAVFFVYTSNDYSIKQGSAFLISNDGLCLSNYHVFEGAKSGKVKSSQGNTYQIIDIISQNEEKDYIVFKISLNDQYITPLKLSEQQPKIGEDCFAIGNPMGLSQTLSKGIISGFRNNGELIQTTAEITHGSSGGALFNNKGEVIGITTAGYGEADLNFAVNINCISYISNSTNAATLVSNSSLNFIVVSERAYFHDEPNGNTRRRGYLLRGNQAVGLKTENNFVYIDFTNAIGQNSKGWIRIEDISFE